MCILDLSKICLDEFHYEYMFPLYREKYKIMYTDTDSLVHHIECEDVYETMKRDIARFTQTIIRPTTRTVCLWLTKKCRV